MPEIECITTQPAPSSFPSVHNIANYNQCRALDVYDSGTTETIGTLNTPCHIYQGTDHLINRDKLIKDSVIQPFIHMLKMYNMHVRDNENYSQTVFVSGGLQQYMIRSKSQSSQDQPRKNYGSEVTTFHDLPDSLQLQIFSYLSANDLCRIASVCSHWLLLTSDTILWQKRLQEDLPTWHIIGHSSNPDIYDECQSDWSPKEIYLQCSPVVQECVKEQNVGVHSLSQFVRSFLPKKTPKLAMFGPGLESSTSGIARKILEGQSDLFKAIGMFPGQFDGVGSGFTIKMHNTTFNLVTLYTSSKTERQNVTHNQRTRVNRMLVQNNQDDTVEDSSDVQIFDVKPAIKDLCRTLDGFIFVVDASLEDKAALHSAQSELFSMVHDQWTQPGAPVLVLSCISSEGS